MKVLIVPHGGLTGTDALALRDLLCENGRFDRSEIEVVSEPLNDRRILLVNEGCGWGRESAREMIAIFKKQEVDGKRLWAGLTCKRERHAKIKAMRKGKCVWLERGYRARAVW